MLRPRSLLVGTLVALAMAACSASAGDGDADRPGGPAVPDLGFTTFDGARTSLDAYAGELLVVNFWASWCPPCIAEMPELEQMHLARGDRIRFIGLNTQDSAAQAASLVDQTGVTYDLGFDPDGELFRAFGVIAMPSTYFVDAAGAIVHRHVGILDETQLETLIDEHLLASNGRP